MGAPQAWTMHKQEYQIEIDKLIIDEAQSKIH